MKATRPVDSRSRNQGTATDDTPVDPAAIQVRRMDTGDISASLQAGWSDFMAKPSHYVMLALIYPLAGLIFATVAAGNNLLPILFPAASGFAIVGPLAALAFLEISRRREKDGDASWSQVAALRRSNRSGSLMTMALVLAVIYLAWLIAAYIVYRATFGYFEPTSMSELLNEVLTTPAGTALLIVGNLVGLAFAICALLVSVVSFPLILDRNADVSTAIKTSIEVARQNPAVVLGWGLTVAVLLVLGSLPLFVGLALVVPLLGHASWHFYRRAVRIRGV